MNFIHPFSANAAMQGGRFCIDFLAISFAFSLLVQATALGAERSAGEKKADEGKASALLQKYRNNLVLIDGKGGSGSGFIAEFKGRKVLVSNAHVLAGISAPTFTSLNGTSLKVRAASVAVAHDLVLLEVVEGEAGMPVALSVDTDAAVGDSVTVLGNPGTGKVVTTLNGQLLGIGPNRVEIDAQIERGSSGSPIIHLRTEKIIGVATWASAEQLLSRQRKLRRFGYRLDSVKQWQPIDWTRFYREAGIAESIRRTTQELTQAREEMVESSRYGRRSRSRRYAYDSAGIRVALDNFFDALNQGQSNVDWTINSLIGALQVVSRTDIAAAKSSFTYDFFRRLVMEKEAEREALLKALTKAFQQ